MTTQNIYLRIDEHTGSITACTSRCHTIESWRTLGWCGAGEPNYECQHLTFFGVPFETERVHVYLLEHDGPQIWYQPRGGPRRMIRADVHVSIEVNSPSFFGTPASNEERDFYYGLEVYRLRKEVPKTTKATEVPEAAVRAPVFGYWQGYTRDSSAPRSLGQTPDRVDVVALAFGVLGKSDPNQILTGFLTSKWSREEILEGVAQLRSRGTKVVLSINGQPDLPKGGWPALDPTTFARNVAACIADWGLDGVDLDNETAYVPGDEFVEVIRALRSTLGPDAILSMPVYKGIARDAFLKEVADSMTYVWTMAYWDAAPAQIRLLEAYQELVGPQKAGMGVGIPGMANPGQSTRWREVAPMAAHVPKAGMMVWALNSLDAPAWVDEIEQNLP